MNTIRISAAQTPDYRDDVEAALQCAENFIEQAERSGARLICFPEGFLQGYWTEEDTARRVALDVRSEAFGAVLNRLRHADLTIVMGVTEADGAHIYNTAVVLSEGRLLGRYRKRHLLASEAFYAQGMETPVFAVDGLRFGINICNDTNFPEAVRQVAESDASLIICSANNMMPYDKAEQWKDAHNSIRGERCRETGLWLVSTDVTGERHARIGLGPTAVLDPSGEVVAQLPLGQRGLLVFDLPVNRGS